MLQPLAEIGSICRAHDALLYVDCTASLAGNPFKTDTWNIDIASAGLQKCLSGPPGVAPITFNERIVEIVDKRKHVEEGIRQPDQIDGTGPIIQSN
jgi:(S)-ureidoglycine-glyoxylate aminotransferase